MPSIVNINNNYGVKNKNTSTELSFDVGEKFTGRVVGVDAKTNTVQIRLQDGWQFEAEVDKDIANLPDGIAKFEVEGFEGGKLKIKLAGRRTGNETSDDALRNFIASEGFSDDDLELIKKMIGNKMDLFKENILKAKGLLNFKQDINNDSRQEADFINKFIETRGIDINSEEAGNIKKVLSEFFSQFKTMSDDDVLLFLKCNIDFTKENIKAFKDIMSSDGKLYDVIKDMKEQIDSLFMDDSSKSTDVKNNIDFKQIENENKQQPDAVKAGNMNEAAADIVNDAEVSEKDAAINDIKDMLKSLSKEINGDGDDAVDKSAVNKNEVNAENTANKTAPQAEAKKENFNIAKSLITQMYNSNKSTQVSVLSLLKAMTGKNNDVIKYVLSNTLENYNLENGPKLSNEFVESMLNNVSEDDILIELTKNAAAEKNSLEGMSKSAVNKSLSNLLGLKIEVSDEQYKNIKNSIKFLLNENYIDKNSDKFSKENLMDTITKGLNLTPDKDGAEVNLKTNTAAVIEDTQKIVKDAIKERTDEIKNIIKDVIKKAGIENDAVSRKVLDIVKNSMSEFKVFNNISNEYYYMDIPLKMREQEYPCKLIIKDDRKNGKQLDSTNLKFVVTVKTTSLGIVDSYVNVKQKHINIDFRCEKSAVRALSAGRQKLMDKLFDLGYTSSIDVSKKSEEVTLVNCDEFFNENGKIHALDRMV